MEFRFDVPTACLWRSVIVEDAGGGKEMLEVKIIISGWMIDVGKHQVLADLRKLGRWYFLVCFCRILLGKVWTILLCNMAGMADIVILLNT